MIGIWIYLSAGYACLIDRADYQLVSERKWCAARIGRRRTPYAASRKKIGFREYTMEKMHRFLLDCPPDLVVDHINGDTLDNRRSNLRICSKRQNTINRRPVSLSGYKGVSAARGGRWRAQISVPDVAKKKFISLGVFDSAWDAAMAYNRAAESMFGEYARLNVRGEGNEVHPIYSGACPKWLLVPTQKQLQRPVRSGHARSI